MDTREIVIKYFDSINNKNWNEWLKLFDNNIIIDEALSGHMEGIKSVKQSVEGIKNNFQKFRNHIQEIVVEGDKAMVVCHIEATTLRGYSFESTGANFYRIDNGKIAYMSSFHDREVFIKAFSDE